MKTKVLILFVLTCLFQSCTAPANDPPPKEDNSVVAHEEQKQSGINSTDENTDTSSSIQIAGEEIESADVEAGVETVIDVTQSVLEAGTEMLKAKRRNDSIKLSRREKMFAYQLGVPVKNEKLVLEVYENFSDKEGVYAFKKGRKEYLLVKYQNKSEDDLDKELGDYKSQHAGEVIGEIKKIDLVRECGKGKAPRLIGKLKSRKNNIQLDCLTCK